MMKYVSPEEVNLFPNLLCLVKTAFREMTKYAIICTIFAVKKASTNE